MKYILVLAAALLTSTAAHSSPETGNVLLSNCNEAVRYQDGILDVDSENALICLAFLDGLKSAMGLWQDKDKASSITCIPMGINNGQASRIIVEYGRKNPSILHHHPIVLAVKAFQDAFPCEEV